jgi:hypothetical protein
MSPKSAHESAQWSRWTGIRRAFRIDERLSQQGYEIVGYSVMKVSLSGTQDM